MQKRNYEKEVAQKELQIINIIQNADSELNKNTLPSLLKALSDKYRSKVTLKMPKIRKHPKSCAMLISTSSLRDTLLYDLTFDELPLEVKYNQIANIIPSQARLIYLAEVEIWLDELFEKCGLPNFYKEVRIKRKKLPSNSYFNLNFNLLYPNLSFAFRAGRLCRHIPLYEAGLNLNSKPLSNNEDKRNEQIEYYTVTIENAVDELINLFDFNVPPVLNNFKRIKKQELKFDIGYKIIGITNGNFA